MPDLKQSLRDFVATSNSKKYKSEDELLSKFPEFKSYDRQSLRDFVATSNSGKYKTEEELFSKFPEFSSKKKETTELPLNQKEVRTSLGTQKTKEQKPSVSSGLKTAEENIYTGYPGKEKNQYRIINNEWQRKEPNANWETVKNSEAIIGLNKQFKKTIEPKVDLSPINKNLLNQDEEDLVPFLNKKYSNLGFKFDQIGIVTDKIRVTTTDGRTSDVFSIDNMFDDEDAAEAIRLKAFIKQNTNTLERDKYNRIQQDILNLKNKPSKEKYTTADALKVENSGVNKDMMMSFEDKLELQKKENEAVQQNKNRTNKLLSELSEAKKTKTKYDDKFVRAKIAATYGEDKGNELAKQNAYIKSNLDDINRASKYLKDKTSKLDSETEQWNIDLANNGGVENEDLIQRKQDLDNRRSFIEEEAKALQVSSDDVSSASNNMAKISAEYLLNQKAKGTMRGALVNEFIKGATSLLRATGTISESDQQDLISSLGSEYTTQEYIKSEDKGMVEKALTGLASSVGAIVPTILTGGTGAFASLSSLSYNDIKEEMNNIEGLKDVNPMEKELLALTYAASVGLLEEFGISKLFSKSPIGKKAVNYILGKSLKEVSKDASSELIEQTIRKNIKEVLVSGAVNVVGGALVEGSTEAAQELVGAGIKEVYDAAKGKDFFDNKDWAARTGESFILGAIGGGIVSAPTQAVYAIKDGLKLNKENKLQNEILESVSTDPTLRDQVKSTIKTKLLNNEITKEEAEEQIKAINESSNIFSKIPDNLNSDNRDKSFNLLNERSKIEKEISGKDPSLVGPQQDRINAINEELKAISNQKQEEDATKESTKQQQESPTVSSSVQYQGVDEGQQEVGQREGAIREAEKQGADISNRPIEGRGVQEEKVAAQEAELFDDVKNANDENELARLYNEEVNNLSAIDEKEKAIHSSISKIKKDSYARFGDVNNISQGMAKTYFNKNGLGIDQVAQEASQSLTGDFASEAITPQDVVDYINKYPNGFNPTTPSGNPRLRAINEKNIELTGKQLNSRIAKIKVNNAGNMDQVVQKDSMLVQAIETAGLLKTMDENINDEGFWTQFPGGFTKEEYELIKKEYNEANREELERISNETESRTNWDTEDDVFGAEVISEVEAETTFDEVKNLDTTDKTNLQKVQSFLDNALNDLDAFGKETLGMNISVAVARVILKTVKRLVDAGVSLEQAFKQAAQENNVQETDVLDAIEKIQNKKKESEASKAAKTISKKEVTKVTVNEYQALKDQIKLEARAARESAKELKSATKNIGESVNDLVSKGKLTAKQAGSILSRFSKLNVLNTTAVDRYLQYVDKIFKNANYLDDLNKATSLRNKIYQYKKNNIAHVSNMAGQFYKIDPSIVDNLNEYTATAEAILNAIKSNRTVSTPFTKLGFKSFETEIKLKEAANINAINSYTEKQLAKQEEILLQEAKDRYREYIDAGIISENVTLEQITSLMKELKGLEQDVDFDEKQKSIEEVIKKEFLDKKSILEDMLKNNGINPLTGEQVEYSEEEAVSIKKLLDIDISLMKKKDIFLALNAMDNFLENGIIDGVNKIVAINKGNQNIKKLVDSNYVAKSLKMYFSKKIGRAISYQLNDIHKTLDRMFGGVLAGEKVARLLGFTDVKNGVAKTDKKITNLINEYTSKFSKLRPNGKNFNSFENIYERGIFSNLIRSPKGSEFAKSEALIKRIKEVKASYENLLNSTNKDKKKEGEIIKSIYDKLNLDKKDITIDEISSKVDEINKDSVQWFVDKWAELYPDLESKSLGMDNTMLVREDNYTPDIVRTIMGIEDIDSNSEITSSNSFVNDPSNVMNKNKSGVLYPSKKVVMGEDKYLSFDFDNNNFRKLRQAILDLNISEASYTLDSALKDSKMMAKLFPNEDDRAMIKRKITSYVNNAKGMRMVDMASVKDIDKFLNSLAKLGTSFGLSAISQLPTQYFGAISNTLAQAAEFVDFSAPFKKEVNDFINRTDTPTANRGKEAITTIESASKYIDKSPDNAWEKTKEIQNKVVDKYLEFIMQNPDIWAARTAFVAYYKQSLKRQGLNYKNLDWENLEVNREAADYAESMVSRQQNTSDQYDKGAIFTNKNLGVKFLKNTLLPFASYAINQHMRMQNDLITLVKGSQAEKDRVIALRSLAGFVSEQIVFHAINYGITEAIAYSFTNEDDEEKEKRKKRSFNYRLSRAINDIISPVPVANDLITKGINSLVTTDLVASLLKVNEEVDKEIDKIKKKREEEGSELGVKEEYDLRKKLQNEKSYSLSIFSNENNYGTYGIAYTKFNEAKAIFSDVYTGEVKIEDQHDKTKTITKYLMQEDRDKLIAPLIVDAVYLSGAVRLREMHKYAMAKKKEIEKNRALTAKEYDIYSAIKEKKSGIKFNPDGYQFVLIKSGLSKENVIDEIKYIEENGGLKPELTKEYEKLRDYNKKEYKAELDETDIKMLQQGKTAEQIIKTY